MAGLVVCSFFLAGVLTGFSATGRSVTLRTAKSLSGYEDLLADSLAPVRDGAARYTAVATRWAERSGLYRPAQSQYASVRTRQTAAPIAIVERQDGFYTLDSSGDLRGPVSPGKEGDLPILSGAALEDARGADLVGYAAILVRAETELSELISEMRIADDGTAALFLEHTRSELVVDVDRAPQEFARAIEALRQLKGTGREAMVAQIDMTVPGEAIVRFHGAESRPGKHRGGVVKASALTPEPGSDRPRKEQAAR